MSGALRRPSFLEAGGTYFLCQADPEVRRKLSHQPPKQSVKTPDSGYKPFSKAAKAARAEAKAVCPRPAHGDNGARCGET